MITQKKLRIKLVVFYQWTSGHLKKVSPEERSEISLKKPLKSHVAKRSSTMFNVVFAGPAGYYSKFFLFYIFTASTKHKCLYWKFIAIIRRMAQIHNFPQAFTRETFPSFLNCFDYKNLMQKIPTTMHE